MQKILLIFSCLFLFFGAVAQSTVEGQVVDSKNGEPLIGVNIRLQNADKGVTTNTEGFFNLPAVELPAVLIVSYVGYQTKTLLVKTEESTQIRLEENTAQLEEVVVTALGIPRAKKALGYAVQELPGDQILEAQNPNLVNALAGRLAGVQINNGSSGIGSSSRIVIRGEGSLSGNNQALFVVDGIPISNELIANNTENDATGFQEVDYGNGAAEISPGDIESVSILKGPAATALYGSRAANGVVVITTKKVDKKGGIGISFNSSATIERVLRLPQYQNVYGQGSGGLFAYEDGNGAGINDEGIRSFGPRLDGQLIPQFNSPSTGVNGEQLRAGDVVARNGNPIQPTPFVPNENNIEDFFETGLTLTNNIALSGGNDEGYFRLSYTNLDNSGIIPNTDLKRHNVSLSGGYQIHPKLRFRTYLSYINSNSANRPASGYGSENAMYLFTWMGRQVDVGALRDYWQAGQEEIRQFNYNYTWMDNPYFALYENTNGFDKDRILGNLSVSYQILDRLELILRTGMDTYDDLRRSRRAFSSQRFRNGAYREDAVKFREINTDFLLRYTAKLQGNWGYQISVGGNRMDQRSSYKSLTANELSVPGIYNFENSRVPLIASQFEQRKRVNSLYALGQLSYQSAFFLDLTVRNDWSSTLPPDNNSYAYYSASLSGVLSEYLELPEQISFAKLRMSVARVGNDTDAFNFRNTFQFGQPYGSFPTVNGSSLLRSDRFRPENTIAFEAGADVRLWLNRLGVDITYYRNTTSDQILELPVPAGSGFTSRLVNGGKIRNQGVELSLLLRPVVNQKFEWVSRLNFSKNVSRVIDLPEGIDQYVTGFARVYGRSDRSVFFIAQEGGQIGDMYGTGFLTIDGKHVYDTNGNPVKDPKLRKLGNYNPEFLLGWDNKFQIGNFDLGFLLDLRYGGTIVSRTYAIASTSGVLENTLVGREGGVVGEGIVNVGTTESPEWVANDKAIDAQSYYNQVFDRDNEANALYDATYLKLREISLGYTFPKVLTERIRLTDLRVSVIARNLAVWTENPHFDPELNAMQGTRFAQGVEDMSYPSSRSLGISLSVKL